MIEPFNAVLDEAREVLEDKHRRWTRYANTPEELPEFLARMTGKHVQIWTGSAFIDGHIRKVTEKGGVFIGTPPATNAFVDTPAIDEITAVQS